MSHLSVGPVHHMRIAVTDVGRSQAFYTEVLGFEVAVAAPPPAGEEHHEVLVDSLQGGVILMHQGMFFGFVPSTTNVPRPRITSTRSASGSITSASPSLRERTSMRRRTRWISWASSTVPCGTSRRSGCRSSRSSTRTASPSN